MNRRQLLLSTAAASLGAWAGPVRGDDRADARREGGGRPSRVVIDLDGRQLTFDEADGQDLGDFAGPGFVQRCIRVTQPDSPLTVFFRPDRDSGRLEVVVELGRLWGEANVRAANLGAYRARISRGDDTLAQVEVPKHDWFSRWRWQPSPRPVVTKTSKLIDAGFLPLPFDPGLLRYCHPSRPARYAGPMDGAGVTKAMPATGDRNDIGPITECQAEYLATGGATALTSLLAQGEAAGSVPWNIRDEATGAPVSVADHPTAHWSASPLGARYRWIKPTATEWRVDIAHQPALSYVPYLLTGDPYFLEGLQFQANWCVAQFLAHRIREGLQIVLDGQVRAYAWGLRSLAQAARVTPQGAPKWLLPRTHWERLLRDNLTYVNRRYVEGKSPTFSVLHAFYAEPGQVLNKADLFLPAWQQDFLTFVLGWMVRMGFESWRPAFEWALGSAIARTGGSRDWPRQFCTPYLMPLFRDQKHQQPIATWAEAWSATKAHPPNAYAEPFPPEPQFAQKHWWGYLAYTQAALALGVRLGVPAARRGYDWTRAMTLDGLGRRRPMTYRWAFAPGVASSPSRARDGR